MEPPRLLESRSPLARSERPALELAPAAASDYYPVLADSRPLSQIWQTVLKRKWTVISTVLIAVVLATVVSFRMTPQYEAAGRIVINRPNTDPLGFKYSVNNAALDTDYDYNVLLDTEVKVLESDTLALQVIKSLQLDRNPQFAGKWITKDASGSAISQLKADPAQETALLKKFRESMRISKMPRTRVVEISFLSPDPRLSALVVNTVMNSFVELNFKTKYEATMQTSEFLARQLVDLRLKAETSQERLVRYQRENDILGIDEKQNITISKLNELNKALTDAQAERIQKEANYQLTLGGNPELMPGVPDSHIIQRLKEQEADLKNQYAEASIRFGPSYPRVIELKNQLEQVEAGIRSEVEKIAARIRNEYLAAQQKQKMLQAALETQKAEANKLNERAIQYNTLKRDVDTNRQLYEGLLERMKEAEVSAGLKSGNVRIVDVARVPSRPAKPNIPMNITLAFLLSLAGGLGLAMLMETIDNTVQDANEAQAVAALPALAIIPMAMDSVDGQRRSRRALAAHSPARPGAIELMSHHRPKSVVAESYRALRTSLLLSSFEAPPKVIVVTSALPGEGKTTTVINISIVLAQKGARVLMVDGDLRHSTIHTLLGLKPAAGLSELLAGRSDFDHAVMQSPQLPNLYVLAGGRKAPNPAELLSAPGMKQYLAQWREKFDHIVIDSPPVLAVTDAVLLSAEADSVLLVVRSQRTTKPALRRTRMVLSQVNARVTGVVVNAVERHAEQYYQYAYRDVMKYYEEREQ